MKSMFSMLIYAFALVLPTLSAASSEINCPTSILESPTVHREEKLWNVVASSTEKPLEHIGVYLGSLADFGALVPDSTTKAKGAEAVTWKLVRAETDKLWIGCSYVGTTAILLREIDSGKTKCVVSYDLLPSGKRQRVNSVTCR